MTKRELLKWLENERDNALDKANEIKREELDKLKSEFSDKLDISGTANKLYPLFDSICTILREYDSKVSAMDKAVFNKWGNGSLCREIFNMQSQRTIAEWLESNTLLGNVPHYVERRRKIIDEVNKVNTTYDVVIDTVANLPSAKLGLEYLEKLGFNTKDISLSKKVKKLPATTSINVDTNYLLIKERKKGDS